MDSKRLHRLDLGTIIDKPASNVCIQAGQTQGPIQLRLALRIVLLPLKSLIPRRFPDFIIFTVPSSIK